MERLILTRPAVEAGEKLGFLPGDLQEKVDPYLRPLYDALYDMVEYEKLQRLFQQRVVEVAPLAYMRGRTLSNAFIILDEAQNTSPEQMKMFLTRMGTGSKVVVTGDITQIDLPTGKCPGLIEFSRSFPRWRGSSSCFSPPRTWCGTGWCRTSWRPTNLSTSKPGKNQPRTANRRSPDETSSAI